MLLGHPSAGRANYIHFRFWNETHTFWIGKHSLGLKIDDALANCLLTLPCDCLVFVSKYYAMYLEPRLMASLIDKHHLGRKGLGDETIQYVPSLEKLNNVGNNCIHAATM